MPTNYNSKLDEINTDLQVPKAHEEKWYRELGQTVRNHHEKGLINGRLQTYVIPFIQDVLQKRKSHELAIDRQMDEADFRYFNRLMESIYNLELGIAFYNILIEDNCNNFYNFLIRDSEGKEVLIWDVIGVGHPPIEYPSMMTLHLDSGELLHIPSFLKENLTEQLYDIFYNIFKEPNTVIKAQLPNRVFAYIPTNKISWVEIVPGYPKMSIPHEERYNDLINKAMRILEEECHPNDETTLNREDMNDIFNSMNLEHLKRNPDHTLITKIGNFTIEDDSKRQTLIDILSEIETMRKHFDII